MTSLHLAHVLLAGAFGAAGQAAVAAAAPTPATAPGSVVVPRVSAPIRIDGDLDDAGWREAARVELRFESNVADNGPPPVATIGLVAYDGAFLYFAFDCRDPDPARIRAPFVDRDNVGSDQDFAGLILDTRGEKRIGHELFVNPRGIHSDGITNDATGNEDFSPDLFWDSAARITATGWTMEARLPFSSLRYGAADPQTWNVLFYRNYPRDYRYQVWNAPLPHGSNCFLCHMVPLTGLAGLPHGGHVVAAPYVTLRRDTVYDASDAPGAAAPHASLRAQVGADVKWTPTADLALDLAVNPDFSQVESDVTKLDVNQRFALFYPEKRPFFLESVDLFDTPINAAYTRTITAPSWGARITGRSGATTYTALVSRDKGGGSIIVPGAQSSDFAPADFASTDTIARVRHDLGRGFAGFLVTDRENQGGSFNRVLGPDFQWRPNGRDELTAQFLYSTSLTPGAPDVHAEWDRRRLGGGALFVQASHSDPKLDLVVRVLDVAPGFRADSGFVPQVGYREVRPIVQRNFFFTKGFFSKLAPFVVLDQFWDRSWRTLRTTWTPGLAFRGKAGLNGELDLVVGDDVRVGDTLVHTRNVQWMIGLAPSRFLSRVDLAGTAGQLVDFDNVRRGTGASVTVGATLRPGRHLSLRVDGTRSWLDVNQGERRGARLFTATIARLNSMYTFSARSFVRVIAEYQRTRRDASLDVADPPPALNGGLVSSALFAYKLNWQSVLYVGCGDGRRIDPADELRRTDRQFFLKASYAFQR